jgi:SAM-dependent methyltransferase
MHDAAYRYVQTTQTDIDLSGAHVLEVGSYDVNGSIRPLFARAARYLGIDRRNGPGVDQAISVQEFAQTHAAIADLVVSCEALEHDPDPIGHLAAIATLLKPGGYLILTCAGPGRTPHGSDGGALQPGEQYGNIDPLWLDEVLMRSGWWSINVQYDPIAGDTYCTARR